MKRRFSADADGVLVDRDGVVLGRLTSVTIDVASEAANSGENGGTYRGSLFLENHHQQKTEDPLTPEAQQVWDLYDHLIGKGRQTLNKARRRDIERALEECELSLVKRAVIGLSRSPHHNGQNDQGRKYLDIRYALRGNGARGESNDERISGMAQLAAPGAVTAASITRDRGVLQGAIDDDKRVVQRSWRRDGSALDADQRRERDEAIARLAAKGITTSYRDSDGWPNFEDADA